MNFSGNSLILASLFTVTFPVFSKLWIFHNFPQASVFSLNGGWFDYAKKIHKFIDTTQSWQFPLATIKIKHNIIELIIEHLRLST